MFVVTYDNGSGWREWGSTPKPTEKEAWEAIGIKPGQQLFYGSDPRIEKIMPDGTSAPIT